MTQAPTTTSQAAPEAKTKQPTQYTILRKHKPALDPSSPSAAVAQPALYEVVGMQLSDNSVQAIRAFVKEKDGDDGVYVAVPSRSWTEKTVAFEATPQLKIT